MLALPRESLVMWRNSRSHTRVTKFLKISLSCTLLLSARVPMSILKPLLLPAGLARRLHAALSPTSFTVVTHVTSDIFGFECLLHNFALSVTRIAFPGLAVVVICMDASAFHSCRSMVSDDFGLSALNCLDATAFGELLLKMATSSSLAAIECQEQRRLCLRRDLYIAQTWAKPSIVHTATMGGFAVVYSDVDIVFHHRVQLPARGTFMLRAGNSGIVVAPPHSEVARQWFEAGRSGLYTLRRDDARALRNRTVNCCDQGALLNVVKHQQSNPAAHLRLWSAASVAECGKKVESGALLPFATHYNCIGDTASEARMFDKARAMRRNDDWLVTHGACAAFGALASPVSPVRALAGRSHVGITVGSAGRSGGGSAGGSAGGDAGSSAGGSAGSSIGGSTLTCGRGGHGGGSGSTGGRGNNIASNSGGMTVVYLAFGRGSLSEATLSAISLCASTPAASLVIITNAVELAAVREQFSAACPRHTLLTDSNRHATDELLCRRADSAGGSLPDEPRYVLVRHMNVQAAWRTWSAAGMMAHAQSRSHLRACTYYIQPHVHDVHMVCARASNMCMRMCMCMLV